MSSKSGKKSEISYPSMEEFNSKKQPSEAELHELRFRLEQLTRSPGKCPVNLCEQMVFPTGFLVHCLHKHARDPAIRISEIYDQQPVRMRFDPREFKFNEPQVLAILLYGGMEGKPRSSPGCRFISFPNAALMNGRRRYENHLAMAVMVCKSTWYALLPDRQLEEQLVVLNSHNASIYVLWLVSPIVTRKFYYTMTVYDRYYKHSRSVIRKIRNYTHSQNPSDFLSQEQNFMILRESEIKDFFRSNGKNHNDLLSNGIHMELMVHEHPSTGYISQTKIKYLSRNTDIDCVDLQLSDLKMPRTKISMPRSVHGKLSMTRKPIPKASSYIMGKVYRTLGHRSAK